LNALPLLDLALYLDQKFRCAHLGQPPPASRHGAADPGGAAFAEQQQSRATPTQPDVSPY
jgi:hypothetical protein